MSDNRPLLKKKLNNVSNSSSSAYIASIVILSLIVVGLLVATIVIATRTQEPFTIDLKNIECLQKGKDVKIVWDVQGTPHIEAQSLKDGMIGLGYASAQDRFYQMDTNRRLFNGTLGELVGPSALGNDYFIRTLRNFHFSKIAVDSMEDVDRELLEAFACGVNTWLSRNPLPSEYAELHLTKESIPLWTPYDTFITQHGFQAYFFFFITPLVNSFALNDAISSGLTQQQAFDLVTKDIFRAEPIGHDFTAPEWLSSYTSTTPNCGVRKRKQLKKPKNVVSLSETQRNATKGFMDKMNSLHRGMSGSNAEVFFGDLSSSGFPISNNDPHLPLQVPSQWYAFHLRVSNQKDRFVRTFPGSIYPWFSRTTTFSNVITASFQQPYDVYVEELTLDVNSFPESRKFYVNPTDVSPIQVPVAKIPESFFVNTISNDAVNNIQPDIAFDNYWFENDHYLLLFFDGTFGVTYKHAVFEPYSAEELRAVRLQYSANTPSDIIDAQRYQDHYFINSLTTDGKTGDIHYLLTGAVPLREDLQNDCVSDGDVSPLFFRDGTHLLAHEWIGLLSPEKKIFSSITKNDPGTRGYFSSNNQDPVGVTQDNNPFNSYYNDGGGVVFLGAEFCSGERSSSVAVQAEYYKTTGDQKISKTEAQEFSNSKYLYVANLTVPYIVQAFSNANGGPLALQSLHDDAAVAEAVARFIAWGVPENGDPFSSYRFTSGIQSGWDIGREAGEAPNEREIKDSIAAMIWQTWQSVFFQNTMMRMLSDAGIPNLYDYSIFQHAAMVKTVTHILRSFDENNGISASGLPFYVGALTAAQNRDLTILQSLKDALDLLKSPTWASAFLESSDQSTYQYGKVHTFSWKRYLQDFPNRNVGPQGNLPIEISFGGGHESLSTAWQDELMLLTPDSVKFGTYMQTFISVVDFAHPDQALSVQGPGNNGNIESNHYSDQAHVYLVGDRFQEIFPYFPADAQTDYKIKLSN